MNIKKVQTTVRLEYENGKIVVQQGPWQPVKGVVGANPLQMVVALLRQQHQTLVQLLQAHGSDGIYKRSQLTLTRMKRAKHRSQHRAAVEAKSPPGEAPTATDATGQ